nr:hypothetical protein [Verrucomicrobiota bacterium JB025]
MAVDAIVDAVKAGRLREDVELGESAGGRWAPLGMVQVFGDEAFDEAEAWEREFEEINEMALGSHELPEQEPEVVEAEAEVDVAGDEPDVAEVEPDVAEDEPDVAGKAVSLSIYEFLKSRNASPLQEATGVLMVVVAFTIVLTLLANDFSLNAGPLWVVR